METRRLPVYLAPMQGYTDHPYRVAHASICGGVDTYYTPFLRVEHGEVRRRDARDVTSVARNTVPQVIARNVDEFRSLCLYLVNLGYTHIDLNMGCPFPMQTSHGRGAGLITNISEVSGIADTMKVFSSDGVVFSVKMRLGNESADEWQGIIDILNNAPLSHITMHPRIGRQQYRGDVDMDMFARFLDRSRHLVVYNGDILSVEDIERTADQLPMLKGVMVGRGLLARPTLAYEYANSCILADDEVREKVLAMHSAVYSCYRSYLEGGEKQILQKMIPFWEYVEPLFGHKFVKMVRKSRSVAAYEALTGTL